MLSYHRRLYERTLSKSTRLPELEAEIGRLEQAVKVMEPEARSLYDYGLAQARQLDGYFQDLLTQNTSRLAAWLANQPPASVASWADPQWDTWNPASSREEPLLRVGELVEHGSGSDFAIPACVPFIGQNGTIIITSTADTAAKARSLLQSLLIRIALMLPHKARYTLLDPAGNGIAFPMGRYLPLVRAGSGDVRRDLDQVTLDIRRIIETYLDASTTSFEMVPEILRSNERFQFVFAADFPNQYDRRAIEALQSIANTGAAAGTYVLVHYNQAYELPRDMSIAGFKNALFLDAQAKGAATRLNLALRLDSAPPADTQARVFDVLARAKPVDHALDWQSAVGLKESDWWRESATQIIETQIGARGGGDRLKLWFGVNHDGIPCAHGMLGAMTGAGKSNLYHVLISGLAIRYSPSELRLYLIDGKDGVEFQPYRHLPHAEVVSLRSSPELSRSVLAELVSEKERRNAMFTRAGVNDFASYRRRGQPDGNLPRILLLVDEYQELFEGDRDGLASSYLLQLAQQGRSAGIHMLLASQRFGAAGMLNQTAIFGNFHLRMAMQMTTADVQALSEFGRNGKNLILHCDLPGKIVVNDRSGDDNANQAGKVAFLTSEKRDALLQGLSQKAKALPSAVLPQRVIFNGQAQPNLLDNPYVANLLQRSSWPMPRELGDMARQPASANGLNLTDWFDAEQPHVVWLGQQFSVRGQAMIVFRRRINEHALIVGGNNAARYGMLAGVLGSLSISTSPQTIQFRIVDRSIPGAQWSDTLRTVHESVLLPAGFASRFSKDNAGVEATLNELVAEIERRHGLDEETLGQEPSIFVVMTELDRVDALRRRLDNYGGMSDSLLGEQLKRVYTEGSPLGIHLVLSFPGVRPMSHVLDERRGLLNFRHRVALQMSEDESHTFVRSRKAAQLQIEGPTPICALYVDIENDVSLRFKPYAIVGAPAASDDSLVAQLQIIGGQLAQRRMYEHG